MPLSTNDFKAELPTIHRRIAGWYQQHGRAHLPWREKGQPYHVYISEVMLQQTQVKTVLERYYFPFLEKFPTLVALAQAPVQEVLKAWEGLGYYTRARNLHAASQQCGEVLPDTVEGLLALSGVGRNTAHAVACFGFGKAVPVMEANVKRVLARVFAMKALEDKTLWARAEELIDRQNPFEYNQAMMDIGAVVCTKRAPRCAECPLTEICRGKADPESYPAAKTAKQTRVRERVIMVFQDKDGRVYVEPRVTRFLGGLWGFAEYEQGEVPQFSGKTYPLTRATLLGQVTQVYSHFTLQGMVYLALAGGEAGGAGRFVTMEELTSLPLSRADAKIAALLAAYRQLA